MAKKQATLPKFIRIEEKKSKYTKDKFYGILRSTNGDIITASVVKIDSNHPWIYVEDFKKSEFEISQATKEDVEHFFKRAKLNAEKELDSAEFDLREKKRNFTTAKERFDEFFTWKEL